MRAPLALAFALGLGALAGCNSYSPNLGSSPFRCGTSEPLCPLGYVCVMYSADEQICQKAGGETPDGSPTGDGGDFQCADDHEVEPNDSLGQATDTFIPSLHNTYKLVGLSICPDTDEDYFKFSVETTGPNLTADLTYDSAAGQLLVDVLNDAGTSLNQGAPLPTDPDTIELKVSNLPQGTYYVHVKGSDGVQNNYSLEITVQ